jgi:hypothetical protein
MTISFLLMADIQQAHISLKEMLKMHLFMYGIKYGHPLIVKY